MAKSTEQPTDRSSRELKSGVDHLRAITGLRFLAALLVYVSHLRLALWPAAQGLSLGAPAVSFFFVLSGFILTYVYTGRLNAANMRRFWFTRLARIWPLHMACLVIFLLLIRGVSGSGMQTNGPANLAAVVTLTHSWIPYSNWYTGFNSVSWSISTEMFFYLVFPLLLIGNRPTFRVRLAIVAALALLSVAATQWALNRGVLPDWIRPNQMAVAFPLARLLEFAMGVATCRLVLRRKKSSRAPARVPRAGDHWRDMAVVAALVIGWWLIWKAGWSGWIRRETAGGVTFSIWLRLAGSGLLFCLVIAHFAGSQGFIGRFLGSAPMVWLGEISYAFYLIHQIILRRMEGSHIPDWQFVTLSLGLAVLASALLFQIVEMPAKAAALKWYDGKGSHALRQMAAQWRTLLTSRSGIALIAGFGGLIVLAAVIEPPHAEQNAVEAIVAETPESWRDVEFEGEAILLGFRVRESSGGLELELAWKPLPGRHRTRFLHVCDEDGNLVERGSSGPPPADGLAAIQPFVERVVVRNRQLAAGESLAIGFWSGESGFAPVHWRESILDKLPIVDLNAGF